MATRGSWQNTKKQAFGLRKFAYKNDSFLCENCGRDVPASDITCRNHCPFCLHSKHVDIFPGDRAETCLGLMKPIGYENHAKKGLCIWYVCLRCAKKSRNVALVSGEAVPDDYAAILKLPGLAPDSR